MPIEGARVPRGAGRSSAKSRRIAASGELARATFARSRCVGSQWRLPSSLSPSTRAAPPATTLLGQCGRVRDRAALWLDVIEPSGNGAPGRALVGIGRAGARGRDGPRGNRGGAPRRRAPGLDRSGAFGGTAGSATSGLVASAGLLGRSCHGTHPRRWPPRWWGPRPWPTRSLRRGSVLDGDLRDPERSGGTALRWPLGASGAAPARKPSRRRWMFCTAPCRTVNCRPTRETDRHPLIENGRAARRLARAIAGANLSLLQRGEKDRSRDRERHPVSRKLDGGDRGGPRPVQEPGFLPSFTEELLRSTVVDILVK
jgi:hypothetical protein